MKLRKYHRYIVLVSFLIGAILLFIFSQTFKSRHNLVTAVFLTISIVTFIGTIFDHKVMRYIRFLLLGTSIAFLVMSFVGLTLKETRLEVELYCLILGIFDIVKGLIKIGEAIYVLKDKNKMGYLFLLDAAVEILLGVLMCIELEETLRTHVILIGINILYEGVMKFINEFVEDKLGQKHNEQIE